MVATRSTCLHSISKSSQLMNVTSLLFKVRMFIDEQNEHPYFFKPDKITKQTMDLIPFNPRLITESNLHDDNRPYRYEQNIQEQQNLFTNDDNYNEDDNNNEEYILENQNEKVAMKILYVT